MQPVTSATTSSHSNAATHVTQIDPWIRQDAAAVAVQRLVQLATAGRVSRGAAQDLLLAAASGAPVPHLPALLNGLVGLIVAHPPPGPVAWPRHPLCRALHVGPSAADAAVQAAVRALWGGRGGATLQRTLRALRPVLWCATCDPGLGPGPRASAAASLARLAAGLAAEPRAGDLEAAASLVSMLCRALSMWDPHDALSLAPVVGPTLDAWQALRFELQGGRVGVMVVGEERVDRSALQGQALPRRMCWACFWVCASSARILWQPHSSMGP